MNVIVKNIQHINSPQITGQVLTVNNYQQLGLTVTDIKINNCKFKYAAGMTAIQVQSGQPSLILTTLDISNSIFEIPLMNVVDTQSTITTVKLGNCTFERAVADTSRSQSTVQFQTNLKSYSVVMNGL